MLACIQWQRSHQTERSQEIPLDKIDPFLEAKKWNNFANNKDIKKNQKGW